MTASQNERVNLVVILDPIRDEVVVKTRYGNHRFADEVDSGVQFSFLYADKGEQALRRYAMRHAMGFSRQHIPSVQ